MKLLIRGTCEGPSGKAEDVCVSVEVLRRSHPECHDFWDGNWVDAAIKAKIPGFTATYECYMRTVDFERFYEHLELMHRRLSGVARLQTMEDGVDLEGQVNERGAISWKGSLQHPVGGSVELKFRFDSDQSYIPEMLTQLEAILQAFPVIGERPPSVPPKPA